MAGTLGLYCVEKGTLPLLFGLLPVFVPEMFWGTSPIHSLSVVIGQDKACTRVSLQPLLGKCDKGSCKIAKVRKQRCYI